MTDAVRFKSHVFKSHAFKSPASNRFVERAAARAYGYVGTVMGPYLGPVSGRIGRLPASLASQGFNAQYLPGGDIELGAHLEEDRLATADHLLHEMLHANTGSEWEESPRVWEGYLDVLTLALCCRPAWTRGRTALCEQQRNINAERREQRVWSEFSRLRWEGQREALRRVGVHGIVPWFLRRKDAIARRIARGT